MSTMTGGEANNHTGGTEEEAPLRAAADSPVVLAIDIGTSSVRAALYDARARPFEGTQVRLERAFCTTADGGAEVDAEASITEVVRVVDAALALSAAHPVSRIESIALSCFWHSLVGVDPAGRAVTPVLGWADTRAAREAEGLRHQLDEGTVHKRTGCPLHASYWPAKLRWLERVRPDEWRAAALWMSFSDLIMLRLTGGDHAALATSVSMASGTGLFNIHRCAWDEPLLGDLNLHVGQLPRLAGAGETFRLAGAYRERWPPLRGCDIFPAVGDGAANNVGEGCATRAEVALMIGTSGAMRVVYEGAAPRDLQRGLWCYRVDRRRIAVGGALSDGGGLYEWLTRSLALDDWPAPEDNKAAGARPQKLAAALADLLPDAHGLTILPFWAGERSLGWEAHASGAILGLTTHTRPIEILRAGIEAVAYRFALIAAALERHAPGAEIRASGGALRASPLWVQILADVLGRPVTLSRVGEASSRGAVLLALEARGALKSVSEISIVEGARCEPDDARHSVYRRGLERQQKIYELLIGSSEVARMLGEARAPQPLGSSETRCADNIQPEGT